jgi:hypothetical protein
LTSVCRRHGVDPQHYFTQLLLNPQKRTADVVARSVEAHRQLAKHSLPNFVDGVVHVSLT